MRPSIAYCNSIQLDEEKGNTGLTGSRAAVSCEKPEVESHTAILPAFRGCYRGVARTSQRGSKFSEYFLSRQKFIAQDNV